MRKTPLFLFLVAASLGACESVPLDDQRLIAPQGVIRGTVLYQGPRPCTQFGHVIGNVIIFVFARNNPPPPGGIATLPVNFGVVSGDTLFGNEPRSPNEVKVCPKDPTEHIAVSAPFAVSPIDAGEYIIQSFYDFTGNFLPSFKFRNLPERGDIGGGYIDTGDAQKHLGEINYSPIFLPVVVGVKATDPSAAFVIPPEGFVADNVSIALGARLPLTRPYFYPAGSDKPATGPAMTPQNPLADAYFAPVVTMTQDYLIKAPPKIKSPDNANFFQASFPFVRLNWALPGTAPAPSEITYGTSPLHPFHFQTAAFAPLPEAGGGLSVWAVGGEIPEGQGVPALYPLAIFSKLIDDPDHLLDPQSVHAQGSATAPVVILQGITLNAADSLLDMILNGVPTKPGDPDSRVDHVTALLRPSVICFDPRHADAGGVLVTPHLTGPSADPNEPGDKDLFDTALVLKAEGKLVRKVALGCLPAGRFAINLVYPTGQAWTVPNESGACAPGEGYADNLPDFPGVLACTQKPRPVLLSQGTRAVLEIVPPTTADGIAYCKAHPVPQDCLQNAP